MEKHPLTCPEPLTMGSPGQGDLEKSLPSTHSPSGQLCSSQVFWESQGTRKILQPLKEQHQTPLPVRAAKPGLGCVTREGLSMGSGSSLTPPSPNPEHKGGSVLPQHLLLPVPAAAAPSQLLPPLCPRSPTARGTPREGLIPSPPPSTPTRPICRAPRAAPNLPQPSGLHPSSSLALQGCFPAAPGLGPAPLSCPLQTWGGPSSLPLPTPPHCPQPIPSTPHPSLPP